MFSVPCVSFNLSYENFLSIFHLGFYFNFGNLSKVPKMFIYIKVFIIITLNNKIIVKTKFIYNFFCRFILCQLWTVYLEQIIALQVITPTSGNRASDEQILLPGSILLDFWGKVTPGILQLVSHSKVFIN